MQQVNALHYKKDASARKSNIELLRIFAMIMIIAHHVAVHAGFSFDPQVISVNRLWIQFIEMGGKIGVNIFVLISGYFLSASARFKSGKLINFWIQLVTYSVVFFCAHAFLGTNNFTVSGLYEALLPITFDCWWYASTYFVLYLLHPFINIFINSLDKIKYKMLLLILTVCWVLIPTFTGMKFQISNLLWFIYLYLLAGYIRKYGSEWKMRPAKGLMTAVIFTAVNFIGFVLFDFLSATNEALVIHRDAFYIMNSLFMFMISLSLFMAFLNMDIPYKKSVNIISSAMFGVYLIHDHPYIRTVSHKIIFKQASYSEEWFLVPYTVAIIVGTFVVCTIAELARIYILEKNYAGVVDKLANKADRLKNRILSSDIFNKF